MARHKIRLTAAQRFRALVYGEIIIDVPDEILHAEVNEMNEVDEVICGWCYNKISSNDDVCKYCGRSIVHG